MSQTNCARGGSFYSVTGVHWSWSIIWPSGWECRMLVTGEWIALNSRDNVEYYLRDMQLNLNVMLWVSWASLIRHLSAVGRVFLDGGAASECELKESWVSHETFAFKLCSRSSSAERQAGRVLSILTYAHALIFLKHKRKGRQKASKEK